MIINLNDQYRITTDALNYVLEEKKIINKGDKVGESYWTNVGYYPSLEGTVSAILKKGIQTTEVEGVQNIINEIKMATRELTERITIEQEAANEGYSIQR